MAGMRSVEELLRDNLLEEEAARRFADGRERVTQRHRHWRANFPAFGALLDSDVERAQALAGNHATEAREIVGVWLAEQTGGEPVPQGDPRIAWVRDFWQAWRAEVFARDDFTAFDEAPRERFTAVFDELSTRFSDGAVAWLREGPPQTEARPTLLQRLFAPIGALARAIEGFFFPSVRR